MATTLDQVGTQVYCITYTVTVTYSLLCGIVVERSTTAG